eukprot:CAMPEP_0173175386 /NCGR_PEP_ID=MMETSP1141-20130122/3887_1 /TAXON_ID=483371 /ORGANISM="non described non described, Strain CCMP2298" /LENGTH=88 /DNA_ID=CAMNT_0014097631 /DNA_START=153 /DNA_END=419 /DNA_ORIENTATION=+
MTLSPALTDLTAAFIFFCRFTVILAPTLTRSTTTTTSSVDTGAVLSDREVAERLLDRLKVPEAAPTSTAAAARTGALKRGNMIEIRAQ